MAKETEKETGNTQVDGSVIHKDPFAEAKARTAAMIKELDQRQQELSSGVADRGPQEQAFTRGQAVQERMPEYRVRYVNTGNEQIANMRKAQGYETVPESEGGHKLGAELTLQRIPRKKYEERVERAEALNRARISDGGRTVLSHEVEKVARELHDKYGIKNVERLLIDG